MHAMHHVAYFILLRSSRPNNWKSTSKDATFV